MLGVVSTALIAAVVLLIPATLLAFTVGRGGRVNSAVTVERAVVGAVGIALGTICVGALLGSGPLWAGASGLLLGSSVLAWLPVARPWATRGVVAWALSVDVGVLYLTYIIGWTISAGFGLAGLVASLLLWFLELFVFLIGVGYLWEFFDVLSRRSWSTYVDAPGLPATRAGRPFVSLHVPTHNEPQDLVIGTLQSLLQLDYDDYEILLVDNNTTDPALWQPVEEFCARHDRITFIHLEDWPGFKSGALNHALTRSDPRAEVIGIVDADYVVQPDFLARCAVLFGSPEVAFVQTPQDYREWEKVPYFRRLYFSYGYFFDVSQRSRNERNGAIFGGTMGLIRRSALADVGGWDEWCITEDAELSLRLLKAGWRGVHVNESFGRGIMPLTFEALKRQRFRWCFGGIQLLRMHWRSLLPGRRTESNRLTLAQRWAYLVGGLQWFGDMASVLFTGFLLLGALDVLGGDGLVVRRLSGLLLLCVVVLVVLGAVRSLALVRRTSGAGWGEALGAFGLWLALGLTVARASVRGLFARQGVFLRTPKVRGELGVGDALRGNWPEAILALACATVGTLALIAGEPGAVAVGALLLVQAVGLVAAPVNSVAAIRSDLPEEFRRRRREAVPSWSRPARRSGFVGGSAIAVLATFVVFAAPVGSPQIARLPDEVTRGARPAEDSATHPPSPTSTPGNAASTTTDPGASTAGQPTAGSTAPGSPSSASSSLPPATEQTQPTQNGTTLPSRADTVGPTQAQSSHATTPPTPTHTTPTGGGKPSDVPTGRP